MTRVLIVDDHEMIADGLSKWIQKTTQLEVIAVARNGRELLRKAHTSLPDIVILDHPMPQFDTRELIAELRHQIPSAHIVIYSMENGPGAIQELLRAGAAAYVLKSDPPEQLLAAIARLNGQLPH